MLGENEVILSVGVYIPDDENIGMYESTIRVLNKETNEIRIIEVGKGEDFDLLYSLMQDKAQEMIGSNEKTEPADGTDDDKEEFNIKEFTLVRQTILFLLANYLEELNTKSVSFDGDGTKSIFQFIDANNLIQLALFTRNKEFLMKRIKATSLGE